MNSIIKLAAGLTLFTVTVSADDTNGHTFDIDNYRSQCDMSKETYLTSLQAARDAYPAYMASLKGFRTATTIHAGHSTSQAYIDERVGLGDWQNLLRAKHKKNLRAWGTTDPDNFHFDLSDYTRVYEHSKAIYETAKTSATQHKKEYLAACQAYEDIQSTYFDELIEGDVAGTVDEEEEGVNIVTGKCYGNTVSGDNVDCTTGTTDPMATHNKGRFATGTTKNECCEVPPVTGQCGGNAETATDLAEASGSGTFQFECGDGFSLKASPATITLDAGDAAAKKTGCCDADDEADVSWSDWSDFAGNSVYSNQLVLGNFKAGWTVDFPMVDSSTLATIQTACNSDQNSADCVLARQSNTFSYNVIDQALTYPTCSYSTFDAIRENVFSSTIALLNSVGADGAAYTARYGDTNCFDRDIAMQQFDVMDFTFDKLTRLGYRLTIPAGKSCVVARGQIPHFNVFGKNITEINTDLTNINTGESPSWPKRQTTYVLDDRAVGVADWGPGTYDVYVADSQFSIPPVPTNVVKKYASTATQENIHLMSSTDHVVRLTFGVPSDILLDTTTDGLNECSFQIEKIYLNDFTYNMVD